MSKAEELKKELAYAPKHAGLTVSAAEQKKAFAFAEDYKQFLDEARTERLAVKAAVARAEACGFKPFEPYRKYKAGSKVYYVNRGKAVILAVIGKKSVKEGVRIAAAHIDSPRLDLKPNPLYESDDIAMFKTHYYGGIKKFQWVTVPLALHGVIVRRDGKEIEVSIGDKEGEPKFVISDILPHLGAEQAQKPLGKAIEAEDLNVIVGSLPFKDDKASELVKLNILKLLNEKYGIVESDFLSAELEVVPAYRTDDIGFDRGLLGGYGHDDRCCAYPALRAVFEAKTPAKTVITVLTDKEEIGSDGNTGMQSAYLKYFIAYLARAEGLDVFEVLSHSECLSADVNSAYDPNFANCFEKNNSSYLNRGVVLTKYTGSRGKGGASDASAEYIGKVIRLMNDKKVVWQIGELGKVDVGGGGTVAKYIAKLDVDVVDLGVPVLSMHAPYEVISKFDLWMAFRAFDEFFKQ
ncbi:MAG: aminopeptidase [Clostridia bacterium]|nr:aminopeptidase [Clostridia bacterium]